MTTKARKHETAPLRISFRVFALSWSYLVGSIAGSAGCGRTSDGPAHVTPPGWTAPRPAATGAGSPGGSPGSTQAQPGPTDRASPPAGIDVAEVPGPLEDVVAAARAGHEKATYVALSPEEMQVMADLVADVATAALGMGPPPTVEELATVPHGLPSGWARIARWNITASLLGLELVVVEPADEDPDAVGLGSGSGTVPSTSTSTSTSTNAGRGEGRPARYVVLREMRGIRRGAGVYAVRAEAGSPGPPARPIVIQAPHSFYDEGTGEIALELFERSEATVLMVNTVHRYLGVPGCGPGSGKAPPKGTSAPADVAHAARSSFQAATQGCARALAGVAFIQRHGYSHDGHADVPKDVDVIASKGEAGKAWQDARFDGLVARLRKRLGGDRHVAVFGRDVFALGGLTNAQATFLNAYSDDAFYHLELSRPLRDRLARSAGLRADVAALLRTLGEAAH